MKNMKKFAALLLTAAMTVAMVGCGCKHSKFQG